MPQLEFQITSDARAPGEAVFSVFVESFADVFYFVHDHNAGKILCHGGAHHRRRVTTLTSPVLDAKLLL